MEKKEEDKLFNKVYADAKEWTNEIVRTYEDSLVLSENNHLTQAILSACDMSDKCKEILAEHPYDGDINVLPYVSLLAAYKSLMEDFDNIVNMFGISKVVPKVGDYFNPIEQEKATSVSDFDFGIGKIYQVVAPGYKYKDKLLRKPKVVVNDFDLYRKQLNIL